MGINIQSKTDYSALFSSMNSSSTNSPAASDITSLLSDYSSIKSGTYSKLLKAYYAKNPSEAKSSTTTKAKDTTESETTKAYNKVSTTSDALQTSIDKLSKLDVSKDDAETLKAVQNYVKEYNNFISASDDVDNISISGRVSTIKNNTASYSKQLSALGITTASDGSLTLNEETFNAADKSSLNTLFAEKSSYGYSVKVSAAMAASNASYEAGRTSLYTNEGNYNLSTGTLMDNLI